MEQAEHSSAAEEFSPAGYWQEHFTRWRASGLSQSEYCRQAGLSRHRFKYWRRKLDSSPLAKRRRRPRASGFVPVQVRAASHEPGLSLLLPNGIVVRGIDTGTVELVGRVVAQL
jgi:hypothetical protein